MPETYIKIIRKANLGIAILGAVYAMVGSAHADPIYRSISPDGEVTYSSLPLPGAHESKAIEIESLSPEQRRAGVLLRRQDKILSAEVTASLQSLESEWRQLDREIVSAQKVLAEAESSLQSGRTPLPGERRGNVSGGSRLTEAYFQRLRQNEMRVEQSKERLDRVYAARNALK